jgi:hypothetical protein
VTAPGGVTESPWMARLSPECAEWVRAAVAAAKPLTDDQRTKLAELLRPARTPVLDGVVT